MVNFEVLAADPFYRGVVRSRKPSNGNAAREVVLRLRCFHLKKVTPRSRKAWPDLCGVRWQQS